MTADRAAPTIPAFEKIALATFNNPNILPLFDVNNVEQLPLTRKLRSRKHVKQ
jgi:hypothetical protein